MESDESSDGSFLQMAGGAVPSGGAPSIALYATSSRKRLRRRLLGAMVAAAPLVLASAAQSHHSFAMFDQQARVTLRGVVKEFRWTNPHAFIQLLVTPDAAAVEEEWSIEMTSPEHLARGGWKPRSLQAGDRIDVVLHPLRDGSHGGQFVSGTRPDGVPLGAASAGQTAGGIRKWAR